MKTYAICFEGPLPEDTSEIWRDFYEHFDGLIAESFGRLVLTVYVDGFENGCAAAQHAFTELRRLLGVTITRIERDLVDASEIARRTNRTRESVRQLVAGERRRGEPFPTPAGAPNGRRVWEWAVVNEWLRGNVPEDAEPEYYLTREQMTETDNWVLRSNTLPASQHQAVAFQEITRPIAMVAIHERTTQIIQAWADTAPTVHKTGLSSKSRIITNQ